jgi:hypothetical protein
VDTAAVPVEEAMEETFTFVVIASKGIVDVLLEAREEEAEDVMDEAGGVVVVEE